MTTEQDWEPPANMEALGQGFYIVRTQAGFRKALKHELDLKGGQVSSTDNFPKFYPALVHITFGYRGYHFPEVSVAHLGDLREAIERHAPGIKARPIAPPAPPKDVPIKPIKMAPREPGSVEILRSKEDRSVNFITDKGFECRYVRRDDDAILVYISSHTGCNQACRMCHLTQTKQVDMVSARTDEMIEQARMVLEYYVRQVKEGKQPIAKRVHFNWMARGEPLLNEDLIEGWEMLEITLRLLANTFAGIPKVEYKISTIMPHTKSEKWFHGQVQPDIYYSLYSLDPGFRRRWVPNAMEPELASRILNKHQGLGGRVIFHWALIEGENDRDLDALGIANWMRSHGFERSNFNLVRYNPYSPNQGREPKEGEVLRYFNILTSHLNDDLATHRIVPRVGFDVKASCGMFVDLTEKSQ